MIQLRLYLARRLLGLTRIVRYLLPALLTDRDYAAWSRHLYDAAESYGSEESLSAGLERWIEERLPAAAPGRRALVIGPGGGREVIPLARLGYAVTAVERSPAMRQRALDNCRRAGVAAELQLGDILTAPLAAGEYDLILAAAFFYSIIIGRPRRVALLRRLAPALRPGGKILLEAVCDQRPGPSRRAHWVRCSLAWLTLGNRRLQPRDYLTPADEILHTFDGPAELAAEAAEAGLRLSWSQEPKLMPGAARLELVR